MSFCAIQDEKRVFVKKSFGKKLPRAYCVVDKTGKGRDKMLWGKVNLQSINVCSHRQNR